MARQVKFKWIIVASVGVLLLLLWIGKTFRKEGIQVAVEKASLHTIIETVTASGKIYPENEVKISPEVSGEIIELTVEEGDSVHKGQLLVKINPAIYTSMVSQAEATVAEARARVNNAKEIVAQQKAQYEQAEATYKRNVALYKDKVISAMEFEQAEATYRSALAAYEAAQASVAGGNYSVQGAYAGLSQAQENLRRTTIVAPTSGVVSALNVKKGERVVGTAQMAGTEMLTIADLGRIEVRVDVSETDISKVKMGDSAVIEADAYRNKKFKGVVSRISVSSKSSTQQITTDQVTNYTVHILILPESYADLTANKTKNFPFKPGMSASVEIQTRKEYQTLSVPVNAVTTRDYPDSLKDKKETLPDVRQVVFVYDPAQKQVYIRDVTTGIQDNSYIQITSGIREGEEVVVAPYGTIARILKDKSKVSITDKNRLFDTEK